MKTYKTDQWQKILLSHNASVLEAIQCIDKEALQIALVIDENKKLLGVVTDGDIRRHLLKQGKLDENVAVVMNKNPITAYAIESEEVLLERMRAYSILHLPIVDEQNHMVGLETLDHLLYKEKQDNWVVFMAGGKGTRLHPLTAECPKPLLKIGTKPISEVLLESFIKHGFYNFYFSVNYKSEMIKAHYGDGKAFGVNIQYIEEAQSLGTAGSLTLLPHLPDKPLIVVNADILTNINFKQLLDFHYHQNAAALATMCVRQYSHTVPYGVAQIDAKSHVLIGLEEKPTHHYFISAGIYVLTPNALNFLQLNAYCDMPHFLLNLSREQKASVMTFPIREYWLDIGHPETLLQAEQDYQEIF